MWKGGSDPQFTETVPLDPADNSAGSQTLVFAEKVVKIRSGNAEKLANMLFLKRNKTWKIDGVRCTVAVFRENRWTLLCRGVFLSKIDGLRCTIVLNYKNR